MQEYNTRHMHIYIGVTGRYCYIMCAFRANYFWLMEASGHLTSIRTKNILLVYFFFENDKRTICYHFRSYEQFACKIPLVMCLYQQWEWNLNWGKLFQSMFVYRIWTTIKTKLLNFTKLRNMHLLICFTSLHSVLDVPFWQRQFSMTHQWWLFYVADQFN